MSTWTRVLGIESSCDETAVAILACRGNEVRRVKDLVTSQVPIHQKYGGVVPEVAARSHVPETVSLLTQALGRRGLGSFDVIAVTQGPGLPIALRVGIEAARVLALLSGKPLIGVNHLEGHVASAWLDPANRRKFVFPLLALVVSGGHTELVIMKDFGDYRLIGETQDDAAGEAFDKTAKLMGLPYPGGPQIAKLALAGDPNAIPLPRPMLHDGTFNMSFSGLKTAVRLAWEAGQATGIKKEDVAASIQQAIVEVLVHKTIAAARHARVASVALVGGVSANTVLRETLGARLRDELPHVGYLPSDRKSITDNAAMIAAAGYWQYQNGTRHDWKKMEARPEWPLGVR